MPAHRRHSASYAVSDRVPMSFRVRPALKAKMEAATALSGRSLMHETESILESHFENQDRMGGARVEHLLKSLAEAAQKQYPGGDGWLDDTEAYAVVADGWYDMIAAGRPIDITAEIARVHEMLDEFPTLPRRLKPRFRNILAAKAELTRLPDELRAKIWQAIEPPPDEAPDEAEVGRTAAVLSISPAEARQMIGRSQAFDDFDAMIDDSKEAILAAAKPVMAAWVAASQTLAVVLGRLPTEQEVAEHFAGSVELQLVAGFQRQQSSERLLGYRAEILRLMTVPEDPPATDPAS